MYRRPIFCTFHIAVDFFTNKDSKDNREETGVSNSNSRLAESGFKTWLFNTTYCGKLILKSYNFLLKITYKISLKDFQTPGSIETGYNPDSDPFRILNTDGKHTCRKRDPGRGLACCPALDSTFSEYIFASRGSSGSFAQKTF